MPIDRRSFLKLLLASAAAEAVDFDKLLWVPKPIVTVPEIIPLLFDQYVVRGSCLYFLIPTPRQLGIITNIENIKKGPGLSPRP